jgi:DNA-binding NtrC family response regulator
LFLDEVGELPAAAQVKLLRAIQEGEVEPVGARKSVKVDVRIVSATNRDLIADVKAGRFREDLFYRLHVFPITVPPLRERPADIPALARHFLARFSAEEGKHIRSIAPDALRLLTDFPWPGNIRQLENALFRGVVLAEGDSLGLAEFPQVAAQASTQNPRPYVPGASPHDHGVQPEEEPGPPAEIDRKEHSTLSNLATERLIAAESSTLLDALALLDEAGEVRSLEELEAELIRYAITHYRGQMSEVARRLRIGRSTLYRKLEALGLDGEPGEIDKDGVAGERQPRKIA